MKSSKKTLEKSGGTIYTQLTLFAEDSRVSPLVLPGTEEAKRMTVTSGLKCSALLKNSSRLGLLVKTLLGSPAWGNRVCILSWKVKRLALRRKTWYCRKSLEILKKEDMKSKSLIFQLAVSMPNIEEKDFGLLPTVRSRMTGNVTEARKKDKNRNLESVLSQILLPTPMARDYRSGMSQEAIDRRMKESSRGVNLSEWTQRHVGGSGKLNPCFLELMMGFPEGWTELNN